MTQEQRFEPAGRLGTHELRRYVPCVVAEVSVTSNFESAGSAGFRPLFNYIAGANNTQSKLAMTSPVIQHSNVAQSTLGQAVRTVDANGHSVGFVMPAQYVKKSDLPAPHDGNVTLREIPEEIVLIDKFSGRWSSSIFNNRVDALMKAAQQHGYVPAGSPRFARFDPPWTPWFMRRNEIQLPVKRA